MGNYSVGMGADYLKRHRILMNLDSKLPIEPFVAGEDTSHGDTSHGKSRFLSRIIELQQPAYRPCSVLRR